jgi:hypothetical protein
MLKSWQTSLNKEPSKGGKEGTKRKDPSLSQKTKPKVGHNRQRNKSCSKTLTSHKKCIEKKKRCKLERMVSLEKPSFATVMCFKVEKHYAKLPTLYVYKNTQITIGRPLVPFVDHAMLAHR